MDLRTSDGSESRFSAFVEGLVSVIGHADRARPLFDYCIGLIMPGERKSVEPMAAVTAPDRTAAQHQSLLHFVGQSPWSDEGVLAKVGEMVLPAIERHGPIEAWIIDDTGFPKKGAHSVGVARQYCCAGASSAIIRISNKRSGSGISKGEVGVASTTTLRCASQPTDSWSPRGRRFPPRDLVPPGRSRDLRFPTVTDPAAPLLRPERHIPNSIATMRRRLIVAIVRNLSRCPCCIRPIQTDKA